MGHANPFPKWVVWVQKTLMLARNCGMIALGMIRRRLGEFEHRIAEALDACADAFLPKQAILAASMFSLQRDYVNAIASARA